MLCVVENNILLYDYFSINLGDAGFNYPNFDWF
jgi:hypothetical protein